MFYNNFHTSFETSYIYKLIKIHTYKPQGLIIGTFFGAYYLHSKLLLVDELSSTKKDSKMVTM